MRLQKFRRTRSMWLAKLERDRRSNQFPSNAENCSWTRTLDCSRAETKDWLNSSCNSFSTGVSSAVVNQLQLESRRFLARSKGIALTWLRGFLAIVLLASAGALLPASIQAQDTRYFVASSHPMEEPGNLEIEFDTNYATQKSGNDFIAPWVEFEYGATAWWTTEFYLDSQATFNDSTLFTGFRWENRFRPLKHEHFVNPVIYIEYENTSGADKILKEIEGH